jgi:hypothetical protein
MKAKKSLLLIALLAFVLAMAFAPVAFAKSGAVVGSEVLRGDMTILVDFKAATSLEGATWKIHNGTGDLQRLGGEGTLVWTDAGMDYSGTIWTNK